MNFKERILTTLNHEEPDQIPVMGLIMDPSTVSQVTGKSATNIVNFLDKPVLGDVAKGLINTNWFWNRMYYGNFSLAMESSIQLEFDANWSIYALMKLYEDPASTLGTAMHDAYGRVWEMGTNDRGDLSVDYSRALCPTEAEWEAWVDAKGPLFDQLVKNATWFHKKLAVKYSHRIMPIGYAAPGIFENSWQAIGFVNFTKLVYENPEFIKRVVAFQTELYLRYLKGVMESGVEVVLGGDDLGQKTGPLMRPALIEKFFGESYRRVADLVHSQGRKFIFHSCGKIYQFLEMFIDWGFDGIITMEPTADMDLARVREQVGHQLALVGNLDVSHLLVRGSQKEVDQAVRDAIRAAGPGGGYILSAAHSHPYVDATRLRWMVEAAHEHGRYPLQG